MSLRLLVSVDLSLRPHVACLTGVKSHAQKSLRSKSAWMLCVIFGAA